VRRVGISRSRQRDTLAGVPGDAGGECGREVWRSAAVEQDGHSTRPIAHRTPVGGGEAFGQDGTDVAVEAGQPIPQALQRLGGHDHHLHISPGANRP
jgi:hypothetical protein